MPKQPSLSLGEILDERYIIEAYIEAGGTGEIYRARDDRLEYRKVAIKLLKPGMPPDQIARFRREALLTGGLSSPHLVRTSDFGTLSNGRCYLVMEYLEGETLAALLEREEQLPLKRSLHIIDGILAALETAHHAGVVHRDLKPENIFLLRGPGFHEHVKLLDFGFARIYAEGAHTLEVTGNTPIIVGTVSYMAPEQLRGQRTDHRSDLFAAAALLFRMLAGILPYPTKGDRATLSAAAFRALRIEEPSLRLTEESDHHEQIALDLCIEQNLSSDPEERMSSAGEMRRSLAEAMGAPSLLPETLEPGASLKIWERKGRQPLKTLVPKQIIRISWGWAIAFTGVGFLTGLALGWLL